MQKHTRDWCGNKCKNTPFWVEKDSRTINTLRWIHIENPANTRSTTKQDFIFTSGPKANSQNWEYNGENGYNMSLWKNWSNHTVKLTRATLPANAGNFTSGLLVKSPACSLDALLALYLSKQANLPVSTRGAPRAEYTQIDCSRM